MIISFIAGEGGFLVELVRKLLFWPRLVSGIGVKRREQPFAKNCHMTNDRLLALALPFAAVTHSVASTFFDRSNVAVFY
jgi:hypothetical protein